MTSAPTPDPNLAVPHPGRRPKRGTGLTDAAIARIRDMIIQGRLVPGQRLPPEQELADQLGLSRTSFREAVRALSVLGILEVRQGDGSYVSDLSPTIMLDALAFVVELHHDSTVLDILQVRRALEVEAVTLATVRASEADISALSATLDEVNADSPQEDLTDNDLRFHQQIAALSGNTYLSSMLDSLTGPTLRARIWRGITDAGVSPRTLAEHRSIVDAMRNGVPTLAGACMAVHIAGVETWLRQALAD